MIIKNYFYMRHPICVFIYFCGVFVLSMAVTGPVFAAVSFVCALICRTYSCGKKAFISSVKTALPIIVFLTAVNPLVNTRGLTVLFHFFTRPVTYEAVIYGLSSGFMLASIILWFALFNDMSVADSIIDVFSSKLPASSLTVVMILRYIPSLMKTAKDVSEIRNTLVPQEKGRFSSIKSMLDVSTVVFEKTLEDSIETARSMKARGYRGGEKRISSRVFRLSDKKCVAVVLLSLVCCAVFLIFCDKFVFYPYIETPENILLAVFSLSVYFTLPVLSDGKDLIICHFSK